MSPRTSIPLLVALVCVLLISQPLAWAQQREPRFIHGFGEVLAGIFWEPPKTVLDATLTGPPVVGTAVGIVGGLSRGIHRVVRGLREIDQAIRPHRGKRSGRR